MSPPDDRPSHEHEHERTSLTERLRPHWRGHVLSFDAQQPPTWDATSGARLLWTFVLVEIALGPRLELFSRLGLGAPLSWLRIPLMLGLVLALVTRFARVRPAALGLRAWASRSTTEKSYFVQVFVFANVLFAVLFSEALGTLAATPSSWGIAVVVFLTIMLWGFYQELV